MNIAYSNIKPATVRTTNSGTVAVSNTSSSEIVASAPIVDLHLSGVNLAKLDIGSESDPMCVMFVPFNGKYVEIARTEVIWDNPNPQWVKVLKAMYIFETNQPLRFCVYDCDSEKGDLSKHDFIGYCDTDVQTIVSNYGQELKLNLKIDGSSKDRGQLIIIGEQSENSNSYINITCSFKDIKKMHTFSRNWPYVVFSKPSESGRDLPAFRSEVLKKCQSGTFRRISIPIQALCYGDMGTPVKVTFYDYREGKVDKEICSTEITLLQIMESQGSQIQLTDSKGKKAGFVKFTNVEQIKKPTFLDYLHGGLQLNLITAIDYTASNRDPRDPYSLHSLVHSPNQYEACIWAVGSVVCPYDTDQQFPVYGFGGKLMGQGTANHCFPLTFNPQQPNVAGLQNIVGAYRNSLQNVQLSGPTYFAPVIRNATQVAIASFAESRTYTILMIVTDGVINDMTATVDAIVDATDAPLSIIIVGVGNADFDAMDVLDADDHPLRSTAGKVMKRDIVQFVPFRQFAAVGGGPALAAAVLEEVPRQVDQFCQSAGFRPAGF